MHVDLPESKQIRQIRSLRDERVGSVELPSESDGGTCELMTKLL